MIVYLAAGGQYYKVADFFNFLKRVRKHLRSSHGCETRLQLPGNVLAVKAPVGRTKSVHGFADNIFEPGFTIGNFSLCTL